MSKPYYLTSSGSPTHDITPTSASIITIRHEGREHRTRGILAGEDSIPASQGFPSPLIHSASLQFVSSLSGPCLHQRRTPVRSPRDVVNDVTDSLDGRPPDGCCCSAVRASDLRPRSRRRPNLAERAARSGGSEPQEPVAAGGGTEPVWLSPPPSRLDRCMLSVPVLTGAHAGDTLRAEPISHGQ